MESEFCTAAQLEAWTGTKASTWRYWVLTGSGPKSFKIGRRRVWRRSEVLAWIAAQEASTGTGLTQPAPAMTATRPRIAQADRDLVEGGLNEDSGP